MHRLSVIPGTIKPGPWHQYERDRMADIRQIAAVQTYHLRHKLLRPHQPMDRCRFAGDDELNTAHFGVYQADQLVGILSVYPAQNGSITMPDSWQLRAMATEVHVRGQGYGAKLMAKAEFYVTAKGGQCIWANARLHAVGFYEKLGYVRVGQTFHIPHVGPHILVCKKLGGRDDSPLSSA